MSSAFQDGADIGSETGNGMQRTVTAMAEKITKAQFEQLEEAQSILSTSEYHEVLQELTGIEARPYTGYAYYDIAGNYVGDSADCDLYDLLKAAYVEVDNG